MTEPDGCLLISPIETTDELPGLWYSVKITNESGEHLFYYKGKLLDLEKPNTALELVRAYCSVFLSEDNLDEAG